MNKIVKNGNTCSYTAVALTEKWWKEDNSYSVCVTKIKKKLLILVNNYLILLRKGIEMEEISASYCVYVKVTCEDGQWVSDIAKKEEYQENYLYYEFFKDTCIKRYKRVILMDKVTIIEELCLNLSFSQVHLPQLKEKYN